MRSVCIAWRVALAVCCLCGPTVRAQYPADAAAGYGSQGAAVIPAGWTLQPIAIGEEHASGLVTPAAHLSPIQGDVGCDVGCADKCGGGCETCCPAGGGFAHCWHFYGEFLYLRARDSEVAWITPANSNFPVPPNPAPVQIGPLGVLDQDYQPGYRAGLQYNMSECSGISAQYTMFEATTDDFVAITGANVVESLVSHPAIDTTAQNFRQGTASYNINYDVLDIDYHKLLWYDCDSRFGYLVGFSAVQMEQQMSATFSGTGSETVQTDIDFYGAGARFGLQGEMGHGGSLRAYAKGIGNLIAGEFRADYDLGHSYDAVVVDTAWRAGRIVGIWDLELGMKWLSHCHNYSANVGYLFSAWTNTVQTDQWIRGVQTNSFIDMDDTMTFDGLVARFEARY